MGDFASILSTGQGLIEMAWKARCCVFWQVGGRLGGEEAGGYVDDPLRGAAALPPRSMA